MTFAAGDYPMLMAGRPRTRMSPEEIALQHAGVAFRAFVRGFERPPPPLRSVEWGLVQSGGAVEFVARFEARVSERVVSESPPTDSPERWRWRVPAHELDGLEPYNPNAERHFHAVYYRAFEDRMVELEVRVVRDQIIEASRLGANPGLIYALQREMACREEHARRHHRYMEQMELPRRRGAREIVNEAVLRLGEPPPATALTMTALERARDIMRGYVPDWPPTAAERAAREQYRAYRDALLAEHRSDPHAEAKAEALLKSWLSPSQLAQYAKTKGFEVIGSATGKRYRINHGRQMNIDELDAEGNKVCGWCFLPQGGLVAGDCMLAQKIALETDERATLKVANRFGLDLGVRGVSIYGAGGMRWVDAILS